MQAPFTPDEDRLILEMKANGGYYQDIGDLLGRSRDSVRSRWRKLNKHPKESNITHRTMKVSKLTRFIRRVKRFFKRS
jgi:hypothetical protein